MALESSQPIFWCQNADYNVAEAPEVVEVEMFQSSLVISPRRCWAGPSVRGHGCKEKLCVIRRDSPPTAAHSYTNQRSANTAKFSRKSR